MSDGKAKSSKTGKPKKALETSHLPQITMVKTRDCRDCFSHLAIGAKTQVNRASEISMRARGFVTPDEWAERNPDDKLLEQMTPEEKDSISAELLATERKVD